MSSGVNPDGFWVIRLFSKKPAVLEKPALFAKESNHWPATAQEDIACSWFVKVNCTWYYLKKCACYFEKNCGFSDILKNKKKTGFFVEFQISQELQMF